MSTNAAPEPGDRDAAPLRRDTKGTRDARIAVIVEAFLRQVRAGGALDPEPYLAGAEELRSDLAPMLANVLRLELIARTLRDNEGAD